MPTHTPHYPDLLFPATRRLRRWEGVLMEKLEGHGYQELRPSLVLREPVEERSICFFDGDHLVALRWDFTVALARMLVRRFPEPPRRISYAGDVFRRTAQPWEPVEHFEVGCEHIHLDPAERREVDLELAKLIMSLPAVLGFKGGILALGHAALLRRPMEAESLPRALASRLVWALDRRSLHRAAEALEGHPAAPRLLAHAETLLAEPDGEASLAALGQSPYAALLEEERAHLQRVLVNLTPLLPEHLTLRLDLADVKGMDYYTGPTLRLWAPGAQHELAAGGRYDGLFPELGRPWYAAGFCVRLTRLLDLAETRPELFETL
ncbi:MAG TPA: ATP phosphoribosyltransferase regulatory subunit [Holophaga sp.]|nr:ATP phosphoribosyltransferase regulatory subunit [Holophaga sp.]HPS67615.1 ATP phosphoribosyltransferase regulatory subunit [Holophaga sp.]